MCRSAQSGGALFSVYFGITLPHYPFLLPSHLCPATIISEEQKEELAKLSSALDAEKQTVARLTRELQESRGLADQLKSEKERSTQLQSDLEKATDHNRQLSADKDSFQKALKDLRSESEGKHPRSCPLVNSVFY